MGFVLGFLVFVEMVTDRAGTNVGVTTAARRTAGARQWMQFLLSIAVVVTRSCVVRYVGGRKDIKVVFGSLLLPTSADVDAHEVYDAQVEAVEARKATC